MCKNKLFQSLGKKNELHTKFRNENNNFAKNLSSLSGKKEKKKKKGF